MNKIKRNKCLLCLKCFHHITIKSLFFNKEYDIQLCYQCGCKKYKTVLFAQYYSSINYLFTFHSERYSVCKAYSSSLYCFTCDMIICEQCNSKNKHKHILVFIKCYVNNNACRCVDNNYYCETCKMEYCNKCDKNHKKHKSFSIKEYARKIESTFIKKFNPTIDSKDLHFIPNQYREKVSNEISFLYQFIIDIFKYFKV